MYITPATFRLSTPSFIAIEGVNGCGKSTLSRGLADRIAAAGHSVIRTREPGGSELGAALRKVLLEWPHDPISQRAELLLFGADRAEHVTKIIKPGLAAGSWVISDRFTYSTIAFQGFGRGLERNVIDQVNSLATGGTGPALVILLDIDPAAGLKRIKKRTDRGTDSFEREDLDFHHRIRDGYLQCAKELPEPFLVLDATLTPESILSSALSVLDLNHNG